MTLVLRGVVVDPAGHPVEGARVGLSAGPAPLPDIAALTSRDGAFSFGVPVPGTYEVWVATDAFRATQKVRVDPGESRDAILVVG
jgi:Carboxypeptidase regulatory-like domain